MEGELIILGCGGSAGVPTIGQWWGNCDPAQPRNVRTRPSVAIRTQNTLLVVDTGPDFQAQMNREQLGMPDAIIITHAHFDHINGLDELRTLQRLHKGRKFPLHALPETLEKLYQRLGYMFQNSEDGFYPSVCEANPVKPGQSLQFNDISITAFEQDHGSIKSLGLRIGNIGYSTDLKSLSTESLDILAGVETWIVDAAGHHSRTNPVHMCIEEIIETNREIGAKNVLLTHLPPTMDYQTLLDELPKGYAPAYDGLKLTAKW